MSKRQFERMAEILRTERRAADTDAERAVLDRMEGHLADLCAEENGRFDRDRFHVAAMPREARR